MSQSSADKDSRACGDAHQSIVNGVPACNTPHGSVSNAKKRPSTDTIDYPRRRAIIACEICRSRKSRCDGNRPRCRLCTELNADCVYREPGIKLDAGDKLILEHLDRIEGLLRFNISCQPQVSNLFDFTSHSPTASHSTNDDILAHNSGNLSGMVPLSQSNPNGFGSRDQFSSDLNTGSKTQADSALNLLQWPLVRDLVPRNYDPQVMLSLEMSREPLNFSNITISLDLSNANVYVHAFFARVNVWYAVVNPNTWAVFYRTAISKGLHEGPECTMVLLVLALGAASNAGSMAQQPINSEPPGINYFAAAWNMLPRLLTLNNVLAPQCQFLAAAYLFYVVRPLDAWNMLTSASMKLQLLLGAPNRLSPQARELGGRVYWNTLLFESDLLADLDLPHSGIVQLEDNVGLPGGFEEELEDAPAGRDELWYFTADIGLRRILNRVNRLINTKTVSSTSTQELEPLVSELDLQLTQWYEGLPLPVQFPHSRVPLSNPVQTALRLRYFACRTAIFRPYILAVLNDESAALDVVVQENCRRCLEACIRQVEHISAHHAGHLPYLWQGALSVVSQTLLVMGATMSPSLSALLPPPHSMDAIINDVVCEIELLAHLAPSLRLSAEIIREAEERRQLFLQSTGLKV
ncbi:putative Zn(II)2Cys6 transcription factor [Phyllosticta citrichinensis]